MMNWLWAGMVLASTLTAAAMGRMDRLFGAAMDGAAGAVKLFITLLAVYALWCGIMEIIGDSGLAERFARALARPLRWLYPSVPAGSPAARHIAMNMAANMLGVGNAATPAGLEAIREMKAMGRGGGEATDDMCMLLVVNCSSLQLIPTTVIALRQAAGSSSASDILLPAILASVTATIFGVAAAKAFSNFTRGQA